MYISKWFFVVLLVCGAVGVSSQVYGSRGGVTYGCASCGQKLSKGDNNGVPSWFCGTVRCPKQGSWVTQQQDIIKLQNRASGGGGNNYSYTGIGQGGGGQSSSSSSGQAGGYTGSMDQGSEGDNQEGLSPEQRRNFEASKAKSPFSKFVINNIYVSNVKWHAGRMGARIGLRRFFESRWGNEWGVRLFGWKVLNPRIVTESLDRVAMALYREWNESQKGGISKARYIQAAVFELLVIVLQESVLSTVEQRMSYVQQKLCNKLGDKPYAVFSELTGEFTRLGFRSLVTAFARYSCAQLHQINNYNMLMLTPGGPNYTQIFTRTDNKKVQESECVKQWFCGLFKKPRRMVHGQYGDDF